MIKQNVFTNVNNSSILIIFLGKVKIYDYIIYNLFLIYFNVFGYKI